MSSAAIAKVQNEYMKRRFSTQYSQYNYEVGKLQFLNKITYPLMMLYFIVAAVYLGIIFIGPNRDKNSYIFKVCALVILILFPFIITPIEYIIVRGVLFVLKTFTGNVFEHDDYDYLKT
jgi:lipopolysaccharide export LptBFGC system permease protein LptF